MPFEATDPDASYLQPDPPTFTFTRVGDLTFALSVTYTIGGGAVNNGDYQFISTVIQVPAGQATVTQTITPNNDGSVEGAGTVALTLVNGADYDIGATTNATEA